ncbi:hypothetical protein [Alteribacter natronophilus]|uniref:hypothetical protein n=1 Tax=Alteribacter natronophilus TaxID=2583810 RepID=UPI00110F5715|nr:hypothetical protein [Alteribacter natronophilus]TMW72072.1 hypothetical protein FGB90_07575 [Alteribacter natronophilus]
MKQKKQLAAATLAAAVMLGGCSAQESSAAKDAPERESEHRTEKDAEQLEDKPFQEEGETEEAEPAGEESTATEDYNYSDDAENETDADSSESDQEAEEAEDPAVVAEAPLSDAVEAALPDAGAVSAFEFELEEARTASGLIMNVPEFLPHRLDAEPALLILGGGHHTARITAEELDESDRDSVMAAALENEKKKSEADLTIQDVDLDSYPELADTFDFYLHTAGHVEGENLAVPNQLLGEEAVFHTLVRIEENRMVTVNFQYEREKQTDELLAEFLQVMQSVRTAD